MFNYLAIKKFKCKHTIVNVHFGYYTQTIKTTYLNVVEFFFSQVKKSSYPVYISLENKTK